MQAPRIGEVVDERIERAGKPHEEAGPAMSSRNLDRSNQRVWAIAAMLENLGDHVRERLRRAEESAEGAKRELPCR